MGLDTSHDCFHGAYSAFHRFRQAVAKATGGRFCEGGLNDDTWEFGNGYDSDTHPGLYAFLMHSDCEGDISPEVALQVANEMEALLPRLREQGEAGGHLTHFRTYDKVAEQFIKGCREAYSENEPVEFH